jgi:hypothetical protein
MTTMTLALICAALLAGHPANDPDPPADLSTAYQEARARAGRSSAEQIRLALWCEAHGLTRERLNHLALAVLSDPANATARGLMGLVAYNGRFQRPEAVAEKAQAAPVLAEYDEKRSKAPYTADGQWAMGTWAEERGLKDQARAHFTAVIRLDPSRETAWKRLGYRKHEGRWVTDAQIAAQKADADAQKQADRKWKPLLDRYKEMLDQPSKREEAAAALAAITDPRAVPSIGRVFGSSEVSQALVVRLLGQIDSQGSSRGLAHLAISSKSAEVRRSATETLRGRDPREYAHLLIGMIGDPIKYEVRPVGGPGSPGVLFVEGQKANLQRLYAPNSAFQPGDEVGIDRFGQPVVRRTLDFFAYSKGGQAFNPLFETGRYTSYSDLYSSVSTGSGDLAYGAKGYHNDFPGGDAVSFLKGVVAAGGVTAHGPLPHIPSSPSRTAPALTVNPRDFATITNAEFPLAQAVAETNRAAMASQQQLASDVGAIEATNRSVGETNDRVVGVLNAATGQSLPASRATWERWWVDILGYAQVAGQTAVNPTFVEVVPSGYQPQLTPSNIITGRLLVNGVSCFGAGTAVQTLTGPRAIESIKVGDRVLTQSTVTGALDYQPILVVHHNPPSTTFLIKLAGDTIVSSPFHRFWKAGKGWVMARDLRAGDRLRLLDGVAEVAAVEEGKVQPVFNLDVAGDADFFAGAAAALVHDNTLPDPRLVPFDAAPAVVAVKSAR